MMDPDHIAYGTLAKWREDIAANATGAVFHAEQAVRYAQAGGDAGMAYSLKCLVACTRAAVASMKDLNEHKQRQGNTHARV